MKKYQKEIDELYDDLIKSMIEDWMNDEDIKELKTSIESLKNYDVLAEKIDIGVKNGYTIEQQLELCKKYIDMI